MAVRKRVTFTDEGEPVVTITVTGLYDAFRFSWALAHLQVEFADLGRRIGGSLRRKLGAKRFNELNKFFTSNEHPTWTRDDEEAAREPLGRDLVAEAMQRAWDEWIADTGCIPDAFAISSGRASTRVGAVFAQGNFAQHVADWIVVLSAKAQREEER